MTPAEVASAKVSAGLEAGVPLKVYWVSASGFGERLKKG
jgi:hypothetical protein